MPVVPTAVVRAKAVDWTQREIVATPDEQILVRRDSRTASSIRMARMDLQTVLLLLFDPLLAKNSRNETVIPGPETRKARHLLHHHSTSSYSYHHMNPLVQQTHR